jgi:hypothetical protein
VSLGRTGKQRWGNYNRISWQKKLNLFPVHGRSVLHPGTDTRANGTADNRRPDRGQRAPRSCARLERRKKHGGRTITETTQYLTFRLAEELFALDIGKVREVLDFTSITKVPQTPDYMRGVINLRGSVVPVVDLRLKFGMAMAEQTVNTCVIIVEVQRERRAPGSTARASPWWRAR